MAQWSPPRPVSGFGSYHSAHGQSGAAASDLGSARQHAQREDAVAVRMRWGCGMVPWLWLPASATRVLWRTCTRIDR
jgi:hypothetical protein